MKNILFIAFVGSLLVLSSCASRKVKEKMTVLQVLATHEYCGGAMPSEELLEDLNKPKPLSNTKIYIAPSGQETSHIHEYKLDKNGMVNLRLEGTDYLVFLYNPVEVDKEIKAQSESADAQDSECLPAWKLLISSDLIIPEEEQEKIEILLHVICDPCELRP